MLEKKGEPLKEKLIMIVDIFYSKKANERIQKIIDTWDVVSKSPYSDSYYNSDDISWGHKPDGSLRISDHWNFPSGGTYHCKTNDKTCFGWYLGRYDAKTDTYTLEALIFHPKELKEMEEEAGKKRAEAIKRGEVVYAKKF